MLQPLSQDAYLPSGARIADDFAVDLSAFQLTLSALTLGYAFGQLIAGPMSDSLGRRRPVFIALTMYVLASVLCAFAPNLEVFVTARIMQGLGASALTVVTNAMMRDLVGGMGLLKLIGRVFAIQSISWLIGPSLGSLLLSFTNWRGVSLLLSGFAVVLLLAFLKWLPETLRMDDRRATEWSKLPKRFVYVLKDRVYLGLLIISIINSIAIYTYVQVVPVLLTQGFAVAATSVGLFLSLGSVGSYTGVQVGAKLSQIFKPQWVLVFALSLYAVIGLIFVFVSDKNPELWLVASLVVIWLFAFGLTVTPIGTLSLTPHPEEAGTASALMGTLGLLGATAAGPFYTTVSRVNTAGIGWTLATLFTIALIVVFVVVQPRKLANLD